MREVIEVVSAHCFNDALEGHGASFGVAYGFRKCLGGQGGDQLHVEMPQGSEGSEGGSGVIGGVIRGPGVLIEGLNDVVRLGQGLSKTEGKNDLAIGQMAHNLRRGKWSIQRQIDLHGLRSDEAREALSAFIREAHKQGIRCIRVVTGKGLGSPGKAPVLKDKVHRWLVQRSEVVAFVQAPPAQGGAGALVVLLQPVR